MNNFHNSDFAQLILRLCAGIILLLHGLHKLFNGMDYVFDSVKAIGLPGFLSYGVYLGEIIGPILVILGFRARIGGFLITFNMLASVLLMHQDIMFKINDFGGWMIELNALLFACGIAIFFAGAGKYSLSTGSVWD